MTRSLRFTPSDKRVQQRHDVRRHRAVIAISARRQRAEWGYEKNGFLDRLITSEDGPDGSIDATEIERIARERILLED